MKSHWCECDRCTYVWLAKFSIEQGEFFAADENGESCPECGTCDFSVGEEYAKGSEL